MVERLGSSVLKEATALLQLHRGGSNQSKVNAPADELFVINDYREKDNDFDEVEFEVNYNEQENVKPEVNNDAHHKINDKPQEAVQDEKKQVVAEAAAKVESRAGKEEKIVDNEKISDVKDFVLHRDKVFKNPQTVKLKFKNLDYSIKEKIKKILEELNAGKISETSANASIARLLRAADMKHEKSLSNKKNFSVKILNKKHASLVLDGAKSVSENEHVKSQVGKIDKFSIKDNNYENANVDKIFSKERLKKLIDLNDKKTKKNILNVKESVADNKEFKFEAKLDGANNKLSNQILDFSKTKTDRPQNVLENNKTALFQQIAKNTKIVLSQAQTKFSTMIRPENLGRIDFKFAIKDGRVNGRMVMQNQETADFFKANVQELRAVFQKANVELDNIDIVLAGSTSSQQNSFNNNKESNDFSDNDLKIDNHFNFSKTNSYEENSLYNLVNYSQREMTRVNLMV